MDENLKKEIAKAFLHPRWQEAASNKKGIAKAFLASKVLRAAVEMAKDRESERENSDRDVSEEEQP